MKASDASLKPLPPGQKARQDFPRFGAFASFEAPVGVPYTLQVSGDIEPISITHENIVGLQRIEQASDFNCVATWGYRGVCWGGVRFRDVFEQLIKPKIATSVSITIVVFRALDKYKASLPLEDVLANDVLFADTLDGQPLSSKHGAPIRLVAPAHYGYKNVKHLHQIELWQDIRAYRPLLPKIMEHPRARVAYEERGRIFPGWLYRYLYRPLINRVVRTMNERYQEN
jgi:DMSO/TMAO reductase YedYZ molybdopterin-dependent catalytic subunit